MHLIDVKSVKLQYRTSRLLPEYAILSHRWTKDEVTFADISSGTLKFNSASVRLKFGGALGQATQHNLEYIWIDTCCINKESSAELSEAINSMYQWYKGAKICYVYLQDVTEDNWRESFPKSNWFKRGWTLQELLAPQTVHFYDCNWHFLGDKESLAESISDITRIPLEVLYVGNLDRYSVAQKMSWAADRVTERAEDTSYCLLGLFDVNMPLLYGEGEKAFVRLQEEIIKQSDDHSIFAWPMGKLSFSGLLAPEPRYFAKCGTMVSRSYKLGREPFSITNRGLSIKLSLTPWFADTYLAFLHCVGRRGLDRRKDKYRVCIFLRRLREDDQYARVCMSHQGLWFDTKPMYWHDNRPNMEKQLFVRQKVNVSTNEDFLRERIYGFKLSENCLRMGLEITAGHRDLDKHCVSLEYSGWGCVAILNTPVPYKGLRRILLGFDFDFNPVCFLEDSSHSESENADSDKRYRVLWSHILMHNEEWDVIVEGSRVYHDNRDGSRKHDGVWRLKGSRQNGLDVVLSCLSTGGGPLVKIESNTELPRSIWEFDIDLTEEFQIVQQASHPTADNGVEQLQEDEDLSRKAQVLEDSSAVRRTSTR